MPPPPLSIKPSLKPTALTPLFSLHLPLPWPPLFPCHKINQSPPAVEQGTEKPRSHPSPILPPWLKSPPSISSPASTAASLVSQPPLPLFLVFSSPLPLACMLGGRHRAIPYFTPSLSLSFPSQWLMAMHRQQPRALTTRCPSFPLSSSCSPSFLSLVPYRQALSPHHRFSLFFCLYLCLFLTLPLFLFSLYILSQAKPDMHSPVTIVLTLAEGHFQLYHYHLP